MFFTLFSQSIVFNSSRPKNFDRTLCSNCSIALLPAKFLLNCSVTMKWPTKTFAFIVNTGINNLMIGTNFLLYHYHRPQICPIEHNIVLWYCFIATNFGAYVIGHTDFSNRLYQTCVTKILKSVMFEPKIDGNYQTWVHLKRYMCTQFVNTNSYQSLFFNHKL